jgi:meiotically up-regulated gene 157 (Mug157) protein
MEDSLVAQSQNLPQEFVAVIEKSASLGKQTATFVKAALTRLWFDAASPIDNGKAFLSTGDIDAMWIRDSTWQVRPLIRFADNPEIAAFIGSIINTQAFYLAIDPYANAFNKTPNGYCWHKDFADQSPWVFERKFELDSITGFWQLSLDFADKGSFALDESWWQLTERLVDLLWIETEHDSDSYILFRPDNPPHDSLSNEGRGGQFKNCGLIWSAFRPSDDACEMPFHIPSNIHASLLLRRLAKAARNDRPDLAKRSEALANQIDAAVKEHAWFEVDGIRTLAYEIDGLGGAVLMDDANYPNLLSLKFLGLADEQVTKNTRDFSLSASNKWHFSNQRISGIGSPHTGFGMVWPLAMAMAGITAENPDEMISSLRIIEQTASGGAIHESFSIDNPDNFTREWFSWAEMTYFELAMRILEFK